LAFFHFANDGEGWRVGFARPAVLATVFVTFSSFLVDYFFFFPFSPVPVNLAENCLQQFLTKRHLVPSLLPFPPPSNFV